ncbi:MAG TPA: type II secretion system minor pseudopilin GspH [Spongiibacteraceae bacterium]|nr:type II secretion system minor pseudopilin GspH [Spongiibacteraceae bacterium]
MLESRRPLREARGPVIAKGFTLLEILVVLVIVAAMAALLVFSYNDSPQRRLQREAADLVALLNAATEEAVMRGIELGVVIDDEGYRFVAFDPTTKQWQAAASGGLAAHNFPEHYAIDFSLDGSEVDQQTIERIKLLSQRSDDERLRPSILILSSGEITPFKLTLRLAENGEGSAQTGGAISLRCDGLNPVMLDLAATVKDRS